MDGFTASPGRAAGFVCADSVHDWYDWKVINLSANQGMELIYSTNFSSPNASLTSACAPLVITAVLASSGFR